MQVSVMVLAAVLLAGETGADPTGADWPSFRGGPEMTGVAGSQLPAKLELLWTYEAGSAVESTAAIAGDRVFFGTYKGEVLCVGLDDGTLKWKFAAGDSVTASPCVADGAVCVGDESGTFYAIDAATGKQKWQFKTDGKIVSSATAASGVVVFGSYDTRLYCLDAKTGAKRWVFETGNYVHASPCVAGGLVIIAGCDGQVRMIDLASGKHVAAAAPPAAKKTGDADAEDGYFFAACPAYADGHVFVGDMAGRYISVRCKDGHFDLLLEDPERRACYAGAAVSGDSVVFGSRGRRVFSIGRKTGKTVWSFPTKGAVDSSPVIVNDRVFVGSLDGNLYGLGLKDGKLLWTFRAGAQITASAAVARGRLVIGTKDGAVYCFGEKKP